MLWRNGETTAVVGYLHKSAGSIFYNPDWEMLKTSSLHNERIHSAPTDLNSWSVPRSFIPTFPKRLTSVPLTTTFVSKLIFHEFQFVVSNEKGFLIGMFPILFLTDLPSNCVRWTREWLGPAKDEVSLWPKRPESLEGLHRVQPTGQAAAPYKQSLLCCPGTPPACLRTNTKMHFPGRNPLTIFFSLRIV